MVLTLFVKLKNQFKKMKIILETKRIDFTFTITLLRNKIIVGFSSQNFLT